MSGRIEEAQMLSDLLARYQRDGDEAAIENLVAATRPRLLAIARRIAGASEAEDVVQTAYLALVRQQRAASEVAVMPWLVATTVRRAYRARATANRRPELAELLAQAHTDTDSPPATLIRAETAERLRRELDRLPDHYRDVLILHHLQGLSTADVADLLGVPKGTVLARLRRGRALLSSRLHPVLRLLFVAAPLALADLAEAAAPAALQLLTTGGIVKAKIAIAAIIVAALGIAAFSLGQLPPSDPDPKNVKTTEAEPTQDAVGGTPVRKIPLTMDRAGGGSATAAGTSLDDTVVDASASAVAAADAQISGVLLDESGAPLAGIALEAVPHLDSGIVERNHESVRRATTDADGAFTLTELTSAKVRLYLGTPGLCGVTPWPFVSDVPSKDLTLIAGRCCSVSGVVRDIEGRAIVGAEVSYLTHQPHASAPAAWARFDRSAKTDERGAFTLAALPTGQVELVATHIDFADESIVVDLDAGDDLKNIDFILDRGLSVTGLVVDDQGAGLAGAKVSVYREIRRSPFATNWQREAMTDESGAFAIFGLEPESYRIHAGHPDYIQVVTGDPMSREVTGGARDIRFVLTAAVAINGMVFDADGAPVEGAVVKGGIQLAQSRFALSPSGLATEQITWTRSDQTGAFELRGLLPGANQFVAFHESHQPSVFAERTLIVGETPESIELRLERGAGLRGRVQASAGEPVAGARITLRQQLTSIRGGSSGSHGDPVQTDAEGRFAIDGLSTSGQYGFTVTAKGLALAPADRLRWVSPGDEEITLHMLAGAVIRGSVRDESGRPLRPQLSLLEGALQGGGIMRDYVASGMPESDGKFELSGISPGSFILSCHRVGELPEVSVPITLAEGEVLEGIEIVMVEGGTITGVVMQGDDKPVVGARISAMPQVWVMPGASQTATSGSDGRFVIGGLTKGEFSINVVPPPGMVSAPNNPTLVRDGDFVEIRVALGAAIIGQIVDSDGAPIQKTRVDPISQRVPMYSRGFGYGNREFNAADGAFALEGLPLEIEEINISAIGYAPRRIEISSLTAGGTLDLGRITMQAQGEICGWIEDASGARVAKATVALAFGGWERDQAVPEAHPFDRTIVSGGDGTFCLGEIGPGRYLLLPNAEGLIGEMVEVEVGAGESRKGLALRVQSGATVAGKITNAEGLPISGVSVHAQRRDHAAGFAVFQRSQRRATDADGGYKIAGLEAGQYRVTVEFTAADASGTNQINGEATLVLGQTTELNLSLAQLCRVRGRVHGASAAEILELQDWNKTGPVISLFLERGRASAGIAADGAFDLGNVPAGVASLRLGQLYTTQVTIPETSEHELELRLPAGRISGRVSRQADGAMAVGAIVELTPAPGGANPEFLPALGWPQRVAVDDDGHFTARFLAPGRWTLRACLLGVGCSQELEIDIEAAEPGGVELVIADGGRLLVKTFSPAGELVAGATIACVDLEAIGESPVMLPSVSASPGADGISTLLTGIPASRVRVIAGSPSMALSWVDIEGAQLRGGDQPMVIELRSPARAGRLRLNRSPGLPQIAGVSVVLLDRDSFPLLNLGGGSATARMWPGSTGMTTSGPMPKGTMRVRILSTENPPREIEITIPGDGSTLTIEI